MATLRSPTGEIILLRGRHLVGRSRTMHTQLTAAAASGEHAVLTWVGDGWTVRDLGSRNGTMVDGQRLPPGVSVPLTSGVTLTFGSPALPYVLVTANAPAPSARCGSELVEGEDDLLALPSLDDPLVIVEHDPKLGWVTLRDGVRTRSGDNHTVEVAGRTWVITIPEALAATADLTRPAPTTGVQLRFRVSADEEYLEIDVVVRGEAQRLKPRAHHDVLLALARERARDAAEGVPLAEQGWLYTSDLAKMLSCTANQLYLRLHRARKDLDDLNLFGPAGAVERRATTHQVRLGDVEFVVRGM